MELSQLKPQQKLEKDDVRCQAAAESRHCPEESLGVWPLAAPTPHWQKSRQTHGFVSGGYGYESPSLITSSSLFKKGPRLEDLEP